MERYIRHHTFEPLLVRRGSLCPGKAFPADFRGAMTMLALQAECPSHNGERVNRPNHTV